ncbi:hypothetical protein HYV83_00365 [Candidatus Woesearchaeota archaeon]|nr:hypothetical protein [Candidatus Woesearchaeota archaeon]
MGMQFLSKLKGDYAKLALIIIVIGAVVRFALAAVSHPAGDACWHLSVARFMAENGRIPFAEPFGIVDRQFFSAAPLFHLIAAAVYKFFSLFSPASAEFAFKMVSPFFGSLALPFVFLLGKKLYNSRVAFFATLFVAFLPLHINSSAVSFVDSLATLLAVVAVYLLFCRRIFLSALFIGLSLEAKQTMLVLLPFFFLILLVYCKGNLKAFFSKSMVSGVIIALIGLPWFVRNYILFGNPVWPFMSKFFGGLPLPELANAHAQFSFGHLFSFDRLARFHFELFGAPVGSLGALSFVNLPFPGVAVAVWIALTLLFILPAFIGVFVRQWKQHTFFLYGWILSFLLVEAAFITTTGLVSARYFLPATPAVALLWALGLDSILKKFSSNKLFGVKSFAVIVVIVIGCVFAFSAVETAKTVVAASAWSAYSSDFGWIRENTPKDALIGYNGQCMSYNAHRFSNYDLDRAGYAWVNQDFRLEPESIVQPSYLQQIERDFVPVYENKVTGTKVYKRK